MVEYLSTLRQVARIRDTIIQTLATLQVGRKIEEVKRREIYSVVKNSDITQASTAAKLQAVIKKL